MGIFRKLAIGVSDLTVAPAFAAPGYRLKEPGFRESDFPPTLRGRVYVVTGANGGIGRSVAEGLARRGATVVMACRDMERAEDARRALVDRLASDLGVSEDAVECRLPIVRADLADLTSVRAAADEVAARFDAIDGLIHNAGMLTHERQLTGAGIELTFSVHVVAPFLLTRRLAGRLQQAGDKAGRVVFVSSGGAYGQPIGLSRLRRGIRESEDVRAFDGVKQYARCKRAQMVLSRQLDERLGGHLLSASMHPGWVDTVGVRESLPRFYRATRRFLRTTEQGADTVVWLAAARSDHVVRGGFYLDRELQPYAIPGTGYEASREDAERLWAMCDEVVSPYCD